MRRFTNNECWQSYCIEYRGNLQFPIGNTALGDGIVAVKGLFVTGTVGNNQHGDCVYRWNAK
jgi:hypothetical protein